MAKSKGRLLSELAEAPKNEDYADVNSLPDTGNKVGDQAFVEETNRLYIWNGSGWYNIALINTAPSITSNHDSSYNLSYNTPLNISVSATDPEGLNLNYSYNTSDSIGNVATITNDSSQFTITPSNNYAVEGTFSLAFRASDGVNIATAGTSTFTLANQAPSLSGNSPSYILSVDGSTATVITLTSVDPEGQPITYSATGNSGFNSIATVSQDSSVFTITPKNETQAPGGGTGTLTFTASDGIKSTSAPSSFTLLFSSTVENSRYTTLLATATGTSDNNNITDASTNNHSITVNGDAHAGTFSPYRSGGYSGLFDSTSVVQLSFGGSSDFEFSSLNFTIEMWFKWNSSSKPETTIFSNRISGSTFDTGRYFLKLMPGDTTSGGIEFSFDCGSPRYRLYCVDNLTADDAFFDEGWHHYAAVRNGTSLKLFVDGQEVDEITLPHNETNFGNSSDNIGLGINSSVSSPTGPDGEYRDVRIVKGVAITPPSGGPTEPLEAVSGTTLLLYNGVGYVKDKSTTNHSPIYGSTVPTITATSPYNYDEYSAADHGGSIYFNPNASDTNYLAVSSLGDIATSQEFQIDFWTYIEDDTIESFWVDGPSTNRPLIYGDESGSTLELHGKVTSTDKVVAKQWNHICISRDSNNVIRIFRNGKLGNSATVTSAFNMSTVYFGGYNSGGSAASGVGYMSDIRLFIGSSLNTSNFTPPTAPLSSSGAALHIKGTDASIIDKSQGSNLKLEGDVDNGWGLDKFITSQQAVEFNGSTQYLTVAGDSDFNFGSNDFTVEAWVYTDSSAEQVITSGRPSSSSWIFLNKTTSDTIRILISTDGSSWAVNSTSTESMTLGRWNHISVSRDGSTINMYLNGRLIISTSISGSIHYNTSESIAIGSGQNDYSDRTWNGYISDFRIINGTAVAPPVNGPNEALTEVTNTKLLTCRPSGASITDLSTTGTTHTITSISSTAAAYASPFGKAMHFDGTGDYITSSSSSSVLGNGDFTVELWLYASSIVSGYRCICSQGSTGTSFRMFVNDTSIQVWNGASRYINYNNSTTANTWYHIAYSHSSSGYSLYVDGSLAFNNGTVPSLDRTLTSINIGGGDGSPGSIDGYIQDFRVTKGLARYTTNFTPPTATLEG